MAEPTSNYPVPPPPPTSPWTPQDPYAPYTSHHRSERAVGPEPTWPYQPGYEPYAGGPGYTGPDGVAPGRQRPPAYWPLSIVGLLFSVLFGAIAIYFSVQVGRRWDRGDVEGAQRASRTARRLGTIAIVVGVVGSAIILAANSR